MKVNVQVIFYSMFGHVWRMAEAVVEGIRAVSEAEASLYQVHELVRDDLLAKSGAKAARAAFEHIPFAAIEQLVEADAIIFGTPARFGNMTSQMRNFLDQTGGIWARGGLIGKVGSVFTSTGTQHGGQETTLTSFHTTVFHHGMIVAGTPYCEPALSNMDEITGGTPYGASTLTKADGSRMPSANELAIARFQGRHIATIAQQLKVGAAALA